MTRFLVDFVERDGLADLIGLMAQFAGASYQVRLQLETECESLAQAVASLTGGMVVTHEERLKLSEVRQAMGFEKHAPAGGNPERACEICGKPAAGKSRLCGSKECENARQSRYDAKWNAKKAAAAAAVEIAVEPVIGDPGQTAEAKGIQSVEGNQPPFPAETRVVVLDQAGKETMEMSFEQMMDHLVEFPENLVGSLFRAAWNGRFYEGRLTADGMSVLQVGGPGLADGPRA